MSDAGSSSIRPPRQERSRRTLDRLLDAAEDLLAERPFDEIRVDEIAERAGYSKGAFYHRFEDKAALLRHLNGRTFEQALEGWREFLAPEAWTDAGLSDVAAAFVRRLVRIYDRSGPLMRAFIYQARWGSDEVVRARARELNGFVRDRFLDIVRSRRSELASGHRERPREVVDFWLVACSGVLSQALLFDGGAPSAVSGLVDASRVEELAVGLLVPFLASGAVATDTTEAP